MSRKIKLGRGIPLTDQSKEIIFNLYEYWRNENKATNINCRFNVTQKVAEALKLSTQIVEKIVQEKKKADGEQSSFTSHLQKRKNLCKNIDIDDFDKGVIRRMIHNFYIVKKQLPTLLRLHNQLKIDINFIGGTSSLYRIIKSLGFRWRKTETNKRLLIEKIDIVTKRVDYLRSISNFRAEGRPIIYLDETYVHSNHCSSKSCSDASNEGFEMPTSKESKFVIVHAGGACGFVPNALLIYKSHIKIGDFPDDINYENYKTWIKTKLIPNLPPRSILIINNAPYHNQVNNPMPNSNSQKAVMVNWLQNNQIACFPTMLKPDLYKLILLNKPRIKNYKVDFLLVEHGHTILRLPPYHPELNPIEYIWTIIKRQVASNNTEMTMQRVQQLVEEQVGNITAEVWKITCEHAEEMEKKYIENDKELDTILDESFVFDTENSSSDDWLSDDLLEED